ncbi:uncharacterized protein [Spinacia oleracea]|uniref:Glycine-rich protein n=1 Tax=Spinacia oleracea TaxID=3562 RepID=A0A9R0IRL1_SPIOL|nr:uncharacterized protein LOC110793669 [Spinacia oleracea]
MAVRSFWFVFLVLILVVVLNVKAREIPQQPKNTTSTTNNLNPSTKDVPKDSDKMNRDKKCGIFFAGVGAAGGVGGAAGVIPIDKGFGTLPTFGGLGSTGAGTGGGLGGGSGAGLGGGLGGGSPPSSPLVPISP